MSNLTAKEAAEKFLETPLGKKMINELSEAVIFSILHPITEIEKKVMEKLWVEVNKTGKEYISGIELTLIDNGAVIQ
jgi:hypothetical protein